MHPPYPRAETMTRVCEAVEGSWRLEDLQTRPGFPHRTTIYAWARQDPHFAQRLKYAREWRRGMKVSATAGPVFDAEQAQAFLLAVRRGGTIVKLVQRPEWPDRVRLNRWKAERPDFAAALAAAALVARKTGPRKWARYDEDVADEIIRRVAFGELIRDIETDRTVPVRIDLARWKAMRPDFAEALRVAKLNGQYHRSRQPRRLTPTLFDHILTRMTAGATLLEVSRDPGLPSYATLMAWQRQGPEFAQMLAWAREEGQWARGLDEVARVDALAGVVRRCSTSGGAVSEAD